MSALDLYLIILGIEMALGKYESSLDFLNELFTNQTVFYDLHVLNAELRCKLPENAVKNTCRSVTCFELMLN
jgi:hypothetical protein